MVARVEAEDPFMTLLNCPAGLGLSQWRIKIMIRLGIYLGDGAD